MNRTTRKELIAYLREFATEERWNKIEAIVKERTRFITVVLEDIYQPHNASAVLRSCEGFGIQDVYTIENTNKFDASSQVTIGADQWLTLHRYNKSKVNNTFDCLSDLKKKGYKIIATTPHKNDIELNDLPIDQKTALVFGTELEGITEEVKDLADGFVKIPMFGFSESFNISVSAAITLHNLTRRLRASDVDWRLSEDEQEHLKYEWLKNSIKAGDQLVQKFFEENSPGR